MMTKRLFLFFAIAAIIAGCNKSQQSASENEAEIIDLTIAEFKANAGDFLDTPVRIKGLVDHACRHSGKRMFIVDPETGEGLKIDAGSDVINFDNSLEGSFVLVTGSVIEKRVDAAYLDEWEAEVEHECAAEKNYAEGEMAEGEEAGTEEQDAELAETLDRITKMRQQIMESEKGYISFFSLEATSYEVVAEEEEGEISE